MLVKLEGKDGFADTVTLFATDPPEGIKIEFDPKEATLSADVKTADYEITALANSDSGST